MFHPKEQPGLARGLGLQADAVILPLAYNAHLEKNASRAEEQPGLSGGLGLQADAVTHQPFHWLTMLTLRRMPVVQKSSRVLLEVLDSRRML